jgi:hypothetical protein
LGSRCGSAVNGCNEKINKIKRSRVHSPARATFFKKRYTHHKNINLLNSEQSFSKKGANFAAQTFLVTLELGRRKVATGLLICTAPAVGS